MMIELMEGVEDILGRHSMRASVGWSRSRNTWTPSRGSPAPSTSAPTPPRAEPCDAYVMGERGAKNEAANADEMRDDQLERKASRPARAPAPPAMGPSRSSPPAERRRHLRAREDAPGIGRRRGERYRPGGLRCSRARGRARHQWRRGSPPRLDRQDEKSRPRVAFALVSSRCSVRLRPEPAGGEVVDLAVTTGRKNGARFPPFAPASEGLTGHPSSASVNDIQSDRVVHRREKRDPRSAAGRSVSSCRTRTSAATHPPSVACLGCAAISSSSRSSTSRRCSRRDFRWAIPRTASQASEQPILGDLERESRPRTRSSTTSCSRRSAAPSSP